MEKEFKGIWLIKNPSCNGLKFLVFVGPCNKVIKIAVLDDNDNSVRAATESDHDLLELWMNGDKVLFDMKLPTFLKISNVTESIMFIDVHISGG